MPARFTGPAFLYDDANNEIIGLRSGTMRNVSPIIESSFSENLQGTNVEVFKRCLSINALCEGEVRALFPDDAVLFWPKNTSWSFQWLYTVFTDDDLPHEMKDGWLILCSMAAAKVLVDRFPKHFVIVVDDGTAKRNDWYLSGSRRNHVAVISEALDITQTFQCLSAAFSNNLLWENDMDRAVFHGGRVDELIALCDKSNMLPGFLCITDTGFNLVHSSRENEAPNNVYRFLIKNGCYEKNEMERLGTIVLGGDIEERNRAFVVCQPTGGNPCLNLHFPIYIDGAYLFHITLAVETGANDNVAFARFQKFCRRAETIFSRYWQTTLKSADPIHRALIGLISGAQLSRDYLETQFAQTKIPEAKGFRLLAVEGNPADAMRGHASVIEALKKHYGGHVHYFVFGQYMLFLLYSLSNGSSALSLRKTIGIVRAEICNKYDFSVGISQYFRDIQKIGFAFRQVDESLKHKALYDCVYHASNIETAGKAADVYPIEYALELMIVNGRTPRDLIDYSLSCSLVEDVAADSKETGIDLPALLWTYLINERNASKTAELLYVHRNTVIYHIKKIEDKYDVSFDDPMIRSRIRLDFIWYFNRQAQEGEITHSEGL